MQYSIDFLTTIAIAIAIVLSTIANTPLCRAQGEDPPHTWIFSYESVVFTRFSKVTVLLRNSIVYTSAKHIHTFKAPSCLADIREFTYSYYILPLLGKVPCTQAQKNHLA